MTKLIWVTPNAEQIIGYCARVSNLSNQENPDVSKLLSYCMKNNHWSVFEMASMCVEIVTSRAISAQILRHRSFSFQEFSQRYAAAFDIVKYDARRQDFKNRQNSFDDISSITNGWWHQAQGQVEELSLDLYAQALEKGIAKECARMILPMATQTRLYMSGTLRSWIHYFNLRCDKTTQLEHRIIAEECKEIFKQECPIIGELV